MFKKQKFLRWLLIYILVILGIAIIVNVLMFLSIPTDSSLNAPTWLGFWGSYLGGAIGCVPALLALYDNRREARRQHEESEKSRRLAAMPVFDCRIRYVSRAYAKDSADQWFFIGPFGDLHEDSWEERLEFDNYLDCNYIELSNCGLGPALQAKLLFNDYPVDLFHIKNGERAYYVLDPSYKYFESLGNKSTVRFIIKSQDIYGNLYSQELLFKVLLCFEDKSKFLQFQTVAIGTTQLLSSENK